MITVRAVPVEATLPLRQQVLRPHQGIDELREPDDDAPGTAAVAAVDDATGEIVAIGTVRRRPPPVPLPADGDGEGEAAADGWQVMAMAVAPGWRGQGLGQAVLDALLAHVEAAGGGTVWCNARVPARGFYERAGFTALGEPFELPDIGPHVVMTTAPRARTPRPG
ncbi:MAG TPA: GNAT family N-acetyltransferase [Acidimicrobiales bacterium]